MENGSLFTRKDTRGMKEAYYKIMEQESALQPSDDENMETGSEDTGLDSATPPELPIEGDMEGSDELRELGQEMDKKTKAHFDKLKSSLEKNDEERAKMLNKVSEEIVKSLSAKKLTKKEIVGILREVIRELE